MNQLPATTPQALAPYTALALPEGLFARAKNVRIVFFDVDGVLTDGSLYYSDQGEVLKTFNSLDGHGLKMLQRAGIVAAIISGRDSPALRTRLGHLGINHFALGTEDKLPAAEKLLAQLGLTWGQAGAMGDDWPDLPVMRRCAFACAPLNAHREVLSTAHFVTTARGGDGAAREFCDLLLVASGRYVDLLEQYTQ